MCKWGQVFIKKDLGEVIGFGDIAFLIDTFWSTFKQHEGNISYATTWKLLKL